MQIHIISAHRCLNTLQLMTYNDERTQVRIPQSHVHWNALTQGRGRDESECRPAGESNARDAFFFHKRHLSAYLLS